MSEQILTKLIENGAAAAVPALLMAAVFGTPMFWIMRKLVDALISSLREMVDHVANLAKAQETCSNAHGSALSAHSAQAVQIQASILDAVRASANQMIEESRANHLEIMSVLRGDDDRRSTRRTQRRYDRPVVATTEDEGAGSTQ